jgi:predicted transcriptional regulator
MALGSDVIQKKRALFETISDLLDTLCEQHSWRHTSLAYRCRLDTRTSAKYVNFLLNAQLAITVDPDRKLQITDKGREFLDQYRKLIEMLEHQTQITPDSSMVGTRIPDQTIE